MSIPIGPWKVIGVDGKEMTPQEISEYNRRFDAMFFNPVSVARLGAAIKKHKALMASLNKKKKKR